MMPSPSLPLPIPLAINTVQNEELDKEIESSGNVDCNAVSHHKCVLALRSKLTELTK